MLDLRARMTSSYTNWLTVPINSNMQSSVDNVIFEMTDSSFKARFKIAAIVQQKNYPIHFYINETDEFTEGIKGSTIGKSNRLIRDLFNKNGNLVRGRFFYEKEVLGIVLTQELLDSLNLGLSDDFLQIKKANQKLTIPIIAVLKEIPGRNNFLITKELHYHLTNKKGKILYPSSVDNNGLFLNLSTEGLKLLPKYKEFLQYYSNTIYEDSLHFILDTLRNMNPVYKLNIKFRTRQLIRLESSTLYSLFVEKLNEAETPTYFNRGYDFQNLNLSPSKSFPTDYLSINFDNDLSHVEMLRDTIKEKFDIEIDIAKVKDKENFKAFESIGNKLMLLFIISAVSFGLMGITFYLNQHLYRIKEVLGNFKAFGLSNLKLFWMYFRIVLKFLVYSTAISFLLASSTFYLINKSLKMELLHQSMFSSNVFLVVAFIVMGGSLLFCWTLIRLLGKTPGELIYKT